MTHAWPDGAVTGIGSLPGTDPEEAARLVFGELSEFAHVPELPARGMGAEMIGRTAALLVDLPVEVAPSAWRLASHGGRELRRARDFLAWDLDALEHNGAGYRGSLKIQAVGPWTLAAALELPSGNRVLSDHGAVRELTESLAEGLRRHCADIAHRFPDAELVLQIDEPSLPSVLGANVPTASGWGTLRAPDNAVVRRQLATVLAVAPGGRAVAHCCAGQPPIGLLREAGAAALALDLSRLGQMDNDALGEAVDAGVTLLLGVLPGTDARIDRDAALESIMRLWNELGFAKSALASSLVLTPTCGLAGASSAYVRRVLTMLRELGSELRELA